MKKKTPARLKRSGAKSNKTNRVAHNAGRAAAAKPTPPPKPAFMQDPNFAQAVQNYEAGLKALQSRKFERSKALLEKVVAGPIRELADRAAVHLNTCNQQLARESTSSFKSPEEHFDYAISLINAGDYDDARSHFHKLQKQYPKADYVYYGLAVLDCLTHQIESALKHLEEAIKREASNRFRARNEPDFQNMADDPRFTELLYPEGPTDAVPAAPAPPPRKSRR